MEEGGGNGRGEATTAAGATFDLETFMLEQLGPRQKPMAVGIPLTVMYFAILVCGLFGNICTLLVIGRSRSMRTTTNFYLFSLAISDILMLIFGLPSELTNIWWFYPYKLGNTMCALNSYIFELTSYVSAMTVTVITVERWFAVQFPLKAHLFTTVQRSLKIIGCIWIIAAICSLPFALTIGTYEYLSHPLTNETLNDSLVCYFKPEAFKGHIINEQHLIQWSTFAFFVTPLVLITVLYMLIVARLRRSVHGQRGPAGAARSQSSTQSSRHKSVSSNLCERSGPLLSVPAGRPRSESQVSVSGSVLQLGLVCHKTHKQDQLQAVLVAVVVAFFVCWAPYHLQRLLSVYLNVRDWNPLLQQLLFYLSGNLYLASAVINPILYNVMSRKFRAHFRRTICSCLKEKPPPAPPRLQPKRSAPSQVSCAPKKGRLQQSSIF